MDTKRRLPIELWLGRGRPISPYLRGFFIDFLRHRFRPRDLAGYPPGLIPDDQQELVERTMLGGWLTSWLEYHRWYILVAMSPDVTIEQFFDAPIVSWKWRVTERDEERTRFGYLFALYDLVEVLKVDFMPPCLESASLSAMTGWLLGGRQGTDFLVKSCGTYHNHTRAQV